MLTRVFLRVLSPRPSSLTHTLTHLFSLGASPFLVAISLFSTLFLHPRRSSTPPRPTKPTMSRCLSTQPPFSFAQIKADARLKANRAIAAMRRMRKIREQEEAAKDHARAVVLRKKHLVVEPSPSPIYVPSPSPVAVPSPRVLSPAPSPRIPGPSPLTTTTTTSTSTTSTTTSTTTTTTTTPRAPAPEVRILEMVAPVSVSMLACLCLWACAPMCLCKEGKFR